jgi:multidrug efflux pump subunit AcrB
VILYTIPLTFAGIFPALGIIGSGEFGFLEIIGLIILVGIVENVAIFLIDAANQNIAHGMEEKHAIAVASGVRFRPVILTKITAIASLAPLAFLSEFYRSISLVIIFGLLASGFVSLITTPILYIFFRWLSRRYMSMRWFNKVLFFPLMPLYLILMSINKLRL